MPDKTKIIWLLIFLHCALLFATTQTQPQSTTPAVVVNEFYQYHFSHDMGFTDQTLQSRAAWLTPEALAASKKYFTLPQNPDEAPYIEGDPFTGSQEYPGGYAVGAESVSGSSAQVPVTFIWKEDGHSTKATVLLKNIGGKWLIDDVTFTDQDSFRKLLTDAVQSQNP